MPNITPKIMRFNDKLVKLAETSSRMSLAAAMVIANPGGASDEKRNRLDIEVDAVLVNMHHLLHRLEEIGQRN
ncbi:MAG: hypothetical protein Q8Q17_01400 [bacterium]|nr:hypothetical protein [bacterium]